MFLTTALYSPEQRRLRGLQLNQVISLAPEHHWL